MKRSTRNRPLSPVGKWTPMSGVWATAVTLILCASGPSRADEEVDFSRDIRPLLSDNCFACHGPDDENRQGGFRLDEKESAYGEADSGERPIVPGDETASELLRRITSEDEDERMPPSDSGKKLSPDDIAVIRRWIEQGADWKQHWALVVPRRPALPAVKDSGWPRSPIDHFILARLEKERLPPSSAADKETLIRRVKLDLTGLPPSLSEVDAFLADESPEAFEKVVDRLLSSPRFGEHMGRFWLDAARYGDTHGLHLDNYREMWPYRDWVVRAFNRNMSFDRFLTEQLAGDLLPEPTLDQLIATGFNRAHVSTNEGGSIKEEVYVRNVVDRVVTTGTVFMGMTFECTRCHDHKYDPFTMKDFYSMFAYFNNLDGDAMDGNRKDPAPVTRVPSLEQIEKLADYDSRIAGLDTKLKEPWPEIDELQAAWESELLASSTADDGEPAIALGDWHTIGPFTDNRRYLVKKKHGPEGKPVNLDEQFEAAAGPLSWTRRPDWTDGKPHSDLPGDTAANFLYRTITVDRPFTVAVSLGSDDGIKVYLNDEQILDKDVSRGVAPDQEKLELKLHEGENHLLLKIMNYGGATGFYFAVKADQSGPPAEVIEIVKTAAGEREQPHQQKLREYFRTKVAQAESLKKVQTELEDVRKSRADVDRRVPTTLIWRESEAPKAAYSLVRGEYDQRGDEVSRRTPEILPPMDSSLPNDRLGLARWLVDPSHPLTARVTVNRFWLQVFGTGIVKTAEDFGSQGEPPSHPDLLDWLAVEFTESGWDVKALMKQLVMSAAYRQSSRVTPELYGRDPGNRMLARGPRFRLDAEMLRDQALFVGGLLNETMGGPGVKPPQPDGLWFAVGYSGSNTVRFVGDVDPVKIHRRTLYTFLKRTSPPPQMSIIDAPSREACTVRRERTNTPLQALLMMNDPQYFEAARALAERAIRSGGTDVRSRVETMFRLCTCRRPEEPEIADLIQDYNDHLAEFQSDPESAAEVVSASTHKSDDGIPAEELAAWTMVANLILNFDEVINKN